jgi:N-acetylglucosamine-6-phosphate deacetylase
MENIKMNSATKLFFNVQLVLPERIVPGKVLVRNGIIEYVAETADASSALPPEWKLPNNAAAPELVDGEGLYLSPGFIDLHNHGRLGCDVMDGKTSSMETIARGQAEHGVTGFLAGTSSIPWEKNLAAMRFLSDYCAKEAAAVDGKTAADSADSSVKGARCLGIYSEGILFSLEKRGAHNPGFLKTTIIKDDIDALLDAAGPALKIAAISPELSGALDAMETFSQKGIVVAAAHTNATYAEALAGIDSGITLATHTFNGMRSLSHQEPGVLGAVLDDSRVTCELVADGVHLAPVILSLVYKLKGPEKIVLVSDSVFMNGVPDGVYGAEGRTAIVKDGIIRLEDGRLAGSSLSLDRAVRNLVNLGGASLCHAVRAASLNPARVIGLDRKKGSIARGKDADLILFDEKITVKKVFIGGQPF